MKKRFVSHALLFVLSVSLLTLGLSSCAGFFKDDSGTASVSFTIDHSIFEANTARDADAGNSGEQFTLVLSLGGDYEDSQTLTWTRGDASTSTIEFDAVPAGSEIYAEAKVFRTRTNGTLQQRYYGKSDTVIIERGENPVSIGIDGVIDTPIVTYSRGMNDYSFQIDGGLSYESTDKNFCFDSDGYFYIKSGTSLSSNNPNAPSQTVDVTSNHGGVYIMTDLTKNVMYIYATDESTVSVYKYPNFISSGTMESVSNATHWNFTLEGSFPSRCVIDNDILFILSEGKELYKTNLQNTTVGVLTTLSNGVSIETDNCEITDILAYDNAVYFLYKNVDTSWDYTSNPSYSDGNIGSFGGLIKYDVSTETTRVIGRSTESVANTSFTDIGMYVYGTRRISSLVYKDRESGTDNLSNPVFLQGHSVFYQNNGDFYMNTRFPTISTPSPLENSLSNTAFYGPDKIIAIKPKKLVIADDGIAFYTDSNFIKYKNVDRIITVDLENFAMTVSETDAKFDYDYTDMISGPFSIGGTGFGSANGLSGSLWYIGDDGAITAKTVGTSNDLRLGITLGE